MKKQAKSEVIKAMPSVLANFGAMPDEAMIRPNVAKIILGISIASFWRLIRDKRLQAYKLTARTTTVKAGDLRAFIASKSGI